MFAKRLRNGILSGLSLLLLTALAQPLAAFELQWYGHAAVKVVSRDGKVILIDPFITKNPTTPDEHKDLAKLGKVDLILITHGHGDHIGDAVAIAKATGAKIALNADMGRTFALLGWVEMDQLIRFNKSGPIKPLGPDITITMVRAEHSSDVSAKDPVTGKDSLYSGGEPSGYIVQFEDGKKLYHAGDTGVFGDMKLIGDYYTPDLALLPIGGHFTMDPAHAAYAVRELLKAPKVMPIHFGTFPPLKGTPDQLREALGDYPVELVIMTPGESRHF